MSKGEVEVEDEEEEGKADDQEAHDGGGEPVTTHIQSSQVLLQEGRREG
jgi:hypothetical protein